MTLDELDAAIARLLRPSGQETAWRPGRAATVRRSFIAATATAAAVARGSDAEYLIWALAYGEGAGWWSAPSAAKGPGRQAGGRRP